MPKYLNLKILIPTLFVVVGTFLFSLYKHYLSTDFMEGIDLFAILITLAAFYYIIDQVMSIKSISENTKETIYETRNNLISNITRADISKGIKTIQEIQGYIRDKKYELSLLRLKEIKHFLIEILNNKNISALTSKLKIRNDLTQVGVHIHSIDKAFHKKSTEEESLRIDGAQINVYLEELSTKLSQIDSDLKYKLEEFNNG